MATKKSSIASLVEEQVETPTIEAPIEDVTLDELIVVEAPVLDIQFIVAGDGDSYPSIADRLAPAGVRARDFANMLIELNNGATVRPGSRIRVSK